MVDGLEWYKYNDGSDIFWVRNDIRGQYEAVFIPEDGEDIYSGEELFFAIPDIGDEKRYDVFMGKMIVSADRVHVAVPAGSFECYKYVFTENDFRSEFYVAEGVGIVRNYFTEGSGIEISFGFIRYKRQVI